MIERDKLAGLVWLLTCATLQAQAGTDPGATAQQTKALIDQFHQVMPAEPAALRDADVRRRIAAAAVPVLRSIREFLLLHADSDLAPRAREFTIYAVVLDDESARGPLRERVAADASAKILLDCAAAITAPDDTRRAASLAAIGAGLGAKTEGACSVVHCLVTAGDLSEAEANQLATKAADKDLAARLVDAGQRARNDSRRLLGKPLELNGRLVTGEAFTTASLRGKVVLVDFWATWCKPCVRSLPDLTAARHKYAAQGLAVVGVSSDREAEALTKFLAARPELDWPQLFEPGQAGWHPLATSLGVTAIPRLFLIDKMGVLRSVDAHGKLDELLVRLLAE